MERPDCNRSIELNRLLSNSVVQSPKYPLPYSESTTCWVNITAPPGFNIVFNFNHFNLEDEEEWVPFWLWILSFSFSLSPSPSPSSSPSLFVMKRLVSSEIEIEEILFHFSFLFFLMKRNVLRSCGDRYVLRNELFVCYKGPFIYYVSQILVIFLPLNFRIT